jgi:hypothetical protein
VRLRKDKARYYDFSTLDRLNHRSENSTNNSFTAYRRSERLAARPALSLRGEGGVMRWKRRFLLSAAFVACAAAVAAQTTGDISGGVTDTNETPLPGVTIEAMSPRMLGARVAVTGAGGVYRISSVPPGNYRIRASLSGFRSIEKTCTVTLGSAMVVDLTMQLETEERVFVSGDVPAVDTSSTTTGTNYTSEIIDHLPVDRNYADIVRSNPGVSTDRGYTDGRMLPLTIYGATSAENQWIIDGVNTTSVNKGTQGKALSTEVIQELEVKTGGYRPSTVARWEV